MRTAKFLSSRLIFLQNFFIPVKYLPKAWFLRHISIPCQILLSGNAVEESRFRPDGVQYCVAQHCLLQCGRIRKIAGLPSYLSNKRYDFMITGMQQCPSQHRVYKQTPSRFQAHCRVFLADLELSCLVCHSVFCYENYTFRV